MESHEVDVNAWANLNRERLIYVQNSKSGQNDPHNFVNCVKILEDEFDEWESIYLMDNEIVHRLVLEDEEDEVEFIRFTAVTEFLLLPLMKMLCKTSIMCGRMWVTEMLEEYP
ncbi:hypothetical protein M9H77_21937 [Catharanthus roseus]|uniref:Uncharacterized protein n=1 Tax=Catharanthus roseus TaxID=4058 RepID=A0ACC0APW2_CATRO|nr:hypothetical protein M9H77_21937 [Catharanthus roseus]